MTNSHPLDPLSADEIRQAAAILRRDRKIGDGWRFASIELKEPAKDALAQLEAGGHPGAREAIVVCWDRADGQARRATVSLSGVAGRRPRERSLRAGSTATATTA